MMLRMSVFLIAFVAALGIFGLDFYFGREIDLWFLYIIPIGIVCLILGARTGYWMVALTVGLLFLDGYLLGNPYSTLLAFLIDRLSEGAMFAFVVYLIDRLNIPLEDDLKHRR